jgi:hypothetical protein
LFAADDNNMTSAFEQEGIVIVLHLMLPWFLWMYHLIASYAKQWEPRTYSNHGIPLGKTFVK